MVFFSAGVKCQQISRSVISILGKGTSTDRYYLNQTAGESFTGTSDYGFRLEVLTQGFQQPTLIDIRNPNGDDRYDAIDVYPNPVTRSSHYQLTVSFRINELLDYIVEIYDTQGRRVYYDELKGLYSQEINLDLSEFRQSIYFVHVFSENRKMDRFFKIEKF